MTDDYNHHGKKCGDKDHENRLHVHMFLTNADVANEHQHVIVGVSGLPIEKGDTHVHRLYVRTSYDPRCGPTHWHWVDICTGPEIKLPYGEHTHYFNGETSFDLGHSHQFASVTDASNEEREHHHR